jgi:hypothetical protein
MTIIGEVRTKSKLGLYSRDEVLAPAMSGPAVILGYLILLPTNHLKAGRDGSAK